jgi:hypothetical protein
LQSALRKPPEGRHRLQQWIVAVFSRIGYHKSLVAIANKHARIIWALLVKGQAFGARRLTPRPEVARNEVASSTARLRERRMR